MSNDNPINIAYHLWDKLSDDNRYDYSNNHRKYNVYLDWNNNRDIFAYQHGNISTDRM